MAIISTIFTMSNGWASKPEKCPSVGALQTLVVQKADLVEVEKEKWKCCTANGFPDHVDGVWRTRGFHSIFSTNDPWVVQWHYIRANTVDQVLLHVTKTLATLTLTYGPTNEYGHFYCSYRSVNGDTDIWNR